MSIQRNSDEKILTLKSGNTLAFQEYGDPNGVPIIFCHGWPSSRTMAELTDNAAREVGARIISPDRPGISRSGFQAERKLADWPPVVRELADSLSLDRFRVLGISGGAPYAFATAWALPERIRAIAVVSGAPPIVDLSHHRDLLRLYRWMLALRRSHPNFLRACFRVTQWIARVRPPVRLRPLLLKLVPPADAEALRDSAAFEACFESQRRAWRGSLEGVMADADIYAQAWGFKLEDVDLPVRLWHGKQDRAFSFRLAEDAAKRLPNCRTRIVDHAGHFSLPIRHMREILQDLIAAGS